MLTAADLPRSSRSRAGRGLPLRWLVLRTHVPAALGLVLSLGVLGGVALVMTFSVEPRLSHLRQAAAAARDSHDAMLDQETGVRGYLATGGEEFLQPYQAGKTRRADADARLIAAVGGDPALLADVLAIVRAQESWEDQWAAPSVDGSWVPVGAGSAPAGSTTLSAHLRKGKELFDAYRTVDTDLQSSIAAEVTAAEGSYQQALLVGVLALGVIGTASLLALVRGSSRLQRQVVAPVLDLTDRVKQVTGGDLSPRPVAASVVDEVAGLSEGVATMTTVLGDRIRVAADREVELVRRGQRLERVLELSRGLSESLSLRYTSLRLIDAVRTLSGAEQADLWLRSRDREELVRYDVSGERGRTVAIDPDVDAGDAIEVGIGAVGRAARYGRAIPLDERRDSQAVHADADGVAIPLVVGSQVIGVLALRPPAGAALDLDLTDALILQGASALQAAQLHGDVEEQSRKDPLTGLANRRQFDEDLATNVARAARYGRPLALLMLDLDHFKQINDTYGHPRGDEVLQDVAGILARDLRGVDTAYRYGGEELCVLMPETSTDEAAGFAERIRLQVETSFPWATRSPVTLSAGVAELPAGGDAPTLVGAADRALYVAKRNGRNRVERSEDLAGSGADR